MQSVEHALSHAQIKMYNCKSNDDEISLESYGCHVSEDIWREKLNLCEMIECCEGENQQQMVRTIL